MQNLRVQYVYNLGPSTFSHVCFQGFISCCQKETSEYRVDTKNKFVLQSIKTETKAIDLLKSIAIKMSLPLQKFAQSTSLIV
jgi:hypothetical protein